MFIDTSSCIIIESWQTSHVYKNIIILNIIRFYIFMYIYIYYLILMFIDTSSCIIIESWQTSHVYKNIIILNIIRFYIFMYIYIYYLILMFIDTSSCIIIESWQTSHVYKNIIILNIIRFYIFMYIYIYYLILMFIDTSSCIMTLHRTLWSQSWNYEGNFGNYSRYDLMYLCSINETRKYIAFHLILFPKEFLTKQCPEEVDFPIHYRKMHN